MQLLEKNLLTAAGKMRSKLLPKLMRGEIDIKT